MYDFPSIAPPFTHFFLTKYKSSTVYSSEYTCSSPALLAEPLMACFRLRPERSECNQVSPPCRSSSIIASLGEQDLTVAEGTEQHIEVDFVIRHSPYRSALHSLAMLRLSRPAQFNQYVKPIPLPSRCPQAGETCQVSGWGSTIPNQRKWM